MEESAIGEIKQRKWVDKPSKYWLSLSPQCGNSDVHKGNKTASTADQIVLDFMETLPSKWARRDGKPLWKNKIVGSCNEAIVLKHDFLEININKAIMGLFFYTK